MSNEEFLDALLLNHGRRFGFSNGCPAIILINDYNIQLFIKTGDAPAIDSLLTFNWHRISMSSKMYPLSDTKNFTELFLPAPVALLPGKPSIGHHTP